MAYTPGSVLIRAIMHNDTGLPEDDVINGFAFELGSAPSAQELDDLFTLVSAFYRTDTAAGANVGEFIGNQVDRAATHELQAFIIQAGPIGSPVATEPWLGPPTSASPVVNMPNECAGVLSFHGDLTGVQEEAGATRPRARRRGRVYIGPVNGAAVDYEIPNPTLGAGFRTTIAQAAVRLMDDSNAGPGPWSVWSRANATLYAVVGGWTDNAIDTQRRRGNAPTVRSTWG